MINIIIITAVVSVICVLVLTYLIWVGISVRKLQNNVDKNNKLIDDLITSFDRRFNEIYDKIDVVQKGIYDEINLVRSNVDVDQKGIYDEINLVRSNVQNEINGQVDMLQKEINKRFDKVHEKFEK